MHHFLLLEVMEPLSKKLADYVESFQYGDIPQGSLNRLKQIILDTMGCVLEGFSSESASIVRKVYSQLDGPKEATILGAHSKASCIAAALSNGVALRFSEFMDYFAIPVKDTLSVFHQCEIIPGALALAEKEGLTGKDLLASVFLGYELSGRMCASVGSTSLASRGWHPSTLGFMVMPLVAGKLLGLKSEQLMNAIGISGCNAAVLGIIDAEGEEYAMVKNIALPLSAQTGIMTAMLAKNGFTGAQRVFEGEKAFASAVLKGDASLEKMLIEGNWVMEARLKPYPVAGAALGIIDAVVTLVKKNSVRAEDVQEILVKGNKRTINHLGDPVKKYPKSKENADHSAPFLIAVALLKGDLKPEDFTDEMYSDPKIHALIGKVRLEISPEFNDPRTYPAAEVQIKTKGDSTYAYKSLWHRGHPRNPMDDKEVEKKFLDLAIPLISEGKAKEIIKAVYRLDRIDDVSELTSLF